MSVPLSPNAGQCICFKSALWLALLSMGACVHTLPPAATPEPIVPALASTQAPQQGQGRLIVDVVDGPTPVQRVLMQAQAAGEGSAGFRIVESAQTVCSASPCVLDVPVGSLLLGFPVMGDPGALETELVYVGPETSVYRRALSEYRDNTGATRVLGIIGTSLGGTAVTTGLVMLPIGLARDVDGLSIAGSLSLGIGGALLAWGIWAISSDAPWYRSGSSAHFALPGSSGQ